MKQAVKSALGLGPASAVATNNLGYGVNQGVGLQPYGPTFATIPVTQTVTVPTVVDSVETIQQPVISQTTTTVQKQVLPAIVEHKEVAPVVHQRIRQEEVEEFQPVIHREREKTEIHKILQPMYTTSTMGIAAEERTLAAQVKPEIRLQGGPAPASILPTTQYESAQRVRVDKAPIIMETEKRRIIEEVQPVVYKEIIQPHVIHITQPIYEKIIEADVFIERILPATTFVSQQTTIAPAISTTSVAPIVSTASVNIAEPTSAFTQTYEINTPVNAPSTTSKIEGVSQGIQVSPVGVSVQPLGGQQGFASSQYGQFPQQGFAQQGFVSSQYGQFPQQGFAQQGLQPGYGQNLGMQPSNLGMQGQQGLNQGFAQQGLQPGYAQQGLNQGFAQQGLQPGYGQNLGMQSSNLGMQGQQGLNQGFAQQGLQPGFAQQGLQPGYGQNLGMQPSNLGMQGQQGLNQGFAQQGFNQGLGQQGFNQGLGQQGLSSSNLGMQSGLGQQGLNQGLGQQMGSQLGSQLGSQAFGGTMGKGLGSSLGSALGSTAATVF